MLLFWFDFELEKFCVSLGRAVRTVCQPWRKTSLSACYWNASCWHCLFGELYPVIRERGWSHVILWRKINRNLIAWGGKTDLEASICMRVVHLICNLLGLRLTRIKLGGLVWQARLQCRLSKPSIILSVFLSGAAAVKLLLTFSLV